MPRPPIQHHRLLLTLPNNWEDVADRAEKIVTIQAVGRASAGFLGNPGNAVLILSAILGIVGGLVGKDGAEVISRFFSTLQGLHAAEPDTVEQREAADAFINAQRGLIEFFAPVLKGFLP